MIPPFRFTGTPTDPFAGMVEFTWGGVLSGGGIGPSRPHAVSNDPTRRAADIRIDGFVIPFTLSPFCQGGITQNMYRIERKMLDSRTLLDSSMTL
jgi:hypothetical protein